MRASIRLFRIAAGLLLAWAAAITPAQAVAPRDYPWEMDFANCVMPQYPKAAQRNEYTGRSTLAFLVRTDGTIAASLVQKSSGHIELDDAAQEALSSCRFKLRAPTAPKEEIWQLVMYAWTLEDRVAAPPQRQLDNSSCTRATYPAGAPDRKMTGALSLALLVRPDGTVKDTRIDSGSGHPALDDATRTALAMCTFAGGGAVPGADEWIKMDYVWSADDLPKKTDPPQAKQTGKNKTQP